MYLYLYVIFPKVFGLQRHGHRRQRLARAARRCPRLRPRGQGRGGRRLRRWQRHGRRGTALGGTAHGHGDVAGWLGYGYYIVYIYNPVFIIVYGWVGYYSDIIWESVGKMLGIS